MNITEYIYLINKPDAVNEKQTVVLEKIVQEFPYFQSARALYLKGLYNQNSFKYNYALKVTAAHTTDRSVLFDFITSDTFTSIHKDLLEQKLSEISAITVKESEVVEPKLEARENTVEQSILSSIKEAGQHIPEPIFDIPAEVNWVPVETDPTLGEAQQTEMQVEMAPNIEESVAETTSENSIASETIEMLEVNAEKIEEIEIAPAASEAIISEELGPEQKLEIGKPLEFSTGERHSFQEWLQLSKFKPIDRSESQSETESKPIETAPEPTGPGASEQKQTIAEAIEPAAEDFSETDLEKQKKNELIDRFIETSPKIPPVKHDTPLAPSIIVEPSMSDNTYLMTETLARVYLEQKKYHKAIQAYEILILKYPEKSSFFADRILDIKNLQQNNK